MYLRLDDFNFEAPASCPRPKNLAASNVTNHTATLTWTAGGEETHWTVEYSLREDFADAETMTVENNPTANLTGLDAETVYYARVKANCGEGDESEWANAISFETEIACAAPTNVAVSNVEPFSATVSWEGIAENYNLRYGTCAEPDPTQPVTIIFHADDVWQDGSGYQMLLDADATAYGTIIPETGGLTTAGDATDEVYAEFEYKIPANADGSCTTSNVVINNTITLQIPAGTYDWCITNPTPGDRIWIASAQGNVGGRADDYVFEGGMTYEFHIYLLGSNDATDVTIMCSNVDWTTVNNATSPYTINGLDPETEYYVGVQAVCGGEDGESAWTTTSFTTPSACDAPVNLEATDLTYNSATLNWTGYQDSYTVRYRTAAHSEATPGGLFEDFESASLETNGWTVLREGEGNENTDWGIYDGNFNGNTVPAHSGTYVVMGRSWSGDAYSVDNWLISPQVTLDGELSYWVLDDGTYHEHYDVYVSTTTTETTAFTLLYQPGNASSEWTQHTVDLSSYAGQQGYIAFRLVDEDKDFLFLDDIIIGSVVEVPAGEWETVTVNEPTYTLTGLTPETKYEWQVQGINPSCTETEGLTEWSEMATFTTLELPTQTIALAEGWNWFSTYIEGDPIELLDALKAALEENGLSIESRFDGLTEYEGEWWGDLDEVGIFNEQMYLIQTSAACTIQLQGEPANAEDHPITINFGWNWVGFPCDQEVSIADAFAGFEAEEGDQLESKEGMTEFDGEEWFGDIETLKPGQGFLYYSNSNDQKTLIFRTGSSKAKAANPNVIQGMGQAKVKDMKTIDIELLRDKKTAKVENKMRPFLQKTVKK
jgi:hypothetical protein